MVSVSKTNIYVLRFYAAFEHASFAFSGKRYGIIKEGLTKVIG